MSTAKFNGFFDPTKVKHHIHIIGCGAIGSTLGVMLARCGLTNIHLWDFDIVQPHNLANQQFLFKHIGQPKDKALFELMADINPHIKLYTHGAWDSDRLDGYVFMAVDSIEIRKQIVKTNLYNNEIKAMFDFRMRLKDAQHYAADWNAKQNRDNLFKTMDFTSEEAKAATPVNACGMTMSIMPTVQTIVSVGVGNFINYINGVPLELLLQANPFDMVIT